ncbi:MAG: transketolase [Candidatus Paceibacterota bacterium]
MNKTEIKKLEQKARKLRRDVLDLALEKGDGHLGGSFSEIEILISLYQKILRDIDKFILSKGHSCYPLYILLQEKGFQPKISGHPDIDEKNGIWCTTGSLGHGLPIGVGMALSRKLMNKKGKIYVLLGDGEIQEGTTWESSLIATHHKLDNLVVIIDKNNLQALDSIKNVLYLKNFKEIFQELGYYVIEINGHSFPEIIKALKTKVSGKPILIIANTIKGKGVSFMENDPKWHARQISLEEFKMAYKELD